MLADERSWSMRRMSAESLRFGYIERSGNQESLSHFDINREEAPVLPVPKTKQKEIQYTKLQRQLSQTR
jgi:hypothetical protein